MSDVSDDLDLDTCGRLQALYDRDGKLTAETVLADPELAHHFEWDDAIAAHQYRLEQARNLVRRFYVTIEERSVRRFVYVPSTGSYTPIKDVMGNAGYRAEVLSRFERDAAAFEARWVNHKFVADAYRRWKNIPI